MNSIVILLSVTCISVIYAVALDTGRPVDQIEHVIIFMQENRPFDHYFGKLRGVRGFNDRTTVPLRSGLNAFYQPVNQSDISQYMLPFHADSNKTNSMCMPAPEMYYPTDIAIWNSGRMDSWNTARDPGMGMSYYTREDLPYYYALYDNFAVGDQYYQSTFTSTTPNRMIFFSGSNGLSVGEEPVLVNDEPRPGYNWTTVGEILEAHNISWRVYQQLDNFDDNGFAWFWNYQKARPGDALFDKGMMRQRSLIEAFRNDMANGTLPSVSWIIAPTRKSEHATNHPCAGEDFTARVLQTLSEFPDIYAKSAFILNYDEGGQFYDHAWVPTPPLSESEGISTVTVEGEVNTDVLTDVPAPIGLGFRVPLLIVSPWTRGNVVVSEAFDHTSIIKFLETRFNISCPTISPWRRAMTGNLMSAFDFDNANYDWPQNLPDTSGYVEKGDIECHTLPPPVVPEQQSMPKQELGTRISRALPYQFLVKDSLSTINSPTLTIDIHNIGSAGAPFVLYDVNNLATENPRQYAVEAGKQIQDTRNVGGDSSEYHFVLMGINGFVREFSGDLSCAQSTTVSASLSYDTARDSIVINLMNSGENSVEFVAVDNAYGQLGGESLSITVQPGMSTTLSVSTAQSGNWYDLTVSLLTSTASGCFSRRYMGRMETGKDTISDPAMSAGLPGLWQTKQDGEHPLTSLKLRQIKRLESDLPSRNKDSLFYSHVVGVTEN